MRRFTSKQHNVENVIPETGRKSFRGLIAFAGTVGAGKSTQISVLSKHLRSKGVRIRITGSPFNNHISGIFLNMILTLLAHKEKRSSEVRAIGETFPHILRRVGSFWLLLDFLSGMLLLFFKTRVFLALGHTVLVEDYIPHAIGTYIHVCRDFRATSPKLTEIIIDILLRSMKGDEVVFFLDGEDRVLQERWERRGSPIEREDYIRSQRRAIGLCQRIGSAHIVIIDTSQISIEDTNLEILHNLRTHNRARQDINRDSHGS